MGEEREQCSPPLPGDIVWRGDVPNRLLPDGSLKPFSVSRRPSLKSRVLSALADAVFCTECLRFRFSPGHLLTRSWHS